MRRFKLDSELCQAAGPILSGQLHGQSEDIKQRKSAGVGFSTMAGLLAKDVTALRCGLLQGLQGGAWGAHFVPRNAYWALQAGRSGFGRGTNFLPGIEGAPHSLRTGAK